MAIILFGVENNKQMIMKIEVIKPQAEVKWNFPCKGICKEDNLIVGFSSYRIGVVLNIGKCDGFSLYDFSKDWKMNDFEPLEEQEKQPIDWDKPEFSIWAQDKDGEVVKINLIDNCDVHYFGIANDKMVYSTRGFPSIIGRDQWLNSLEILPKGTEIKITF